jgi:hypothetical protein
VQSESQTSVPAHHWQGVFAELLTPGPKGA